MLTCFGVDPGGSAWRIAAMTFPSPLTPPAQRESRIVEMGGRALAALADHGYHAWCERQARALTDLSRDPLLTDEAALGEQLQDRLVALDLAESYNEQKTTYDWGTPRAVGVCHPYAATVLARRILPVLFEGKPVAATRRTELNAAPREADLPDGARLCAIETPLAGCLDLVASGEVAFPADLLLLTGHPQTAELAALRAELRGDELMLHVRWSQMLNPAADRGTSELLRSFATMKPFPPPRWRLISFGEHLAALAGQVARTLKVAPHDVVCHAEERLAIGAARYAAWCMERVLHGAAGPVHRLRVVSVLPHDFGLIGEGADGALFWHRLFGRQSNPLDKPIRVPLSTPPPPMLLFATRENGAVPSAAWLERARWREHDLRWFGVATVDWPENQTAGQLIVRAIMPADRLASRWNDVTVEIGAET